MMIEINIIIIILKIYYILFHPQGKDGPIDLREMITDYKEYLNNVRLDKTWADALAVVATDNLLKRDILIVNSSPNANMNPFHIISEDVKIVNHCC